MNKQGKVFNGNIETLKNSRYLRAYHLDGKEVDVTIAEVRVEEVESRDGDEHNMAVLYFEGKKLGFGLGDLLRPRPKTTKQDDARRHQSGQAEQCRRCGNG